MRPGLVGGGTSLRGSFEVSKPSPIPSLVSSLCLELVIDCYMSSQLLLQ